MKKYSDLLKLIFSFIVFFFSSFVCVLFLQYVLQIDVANLDVKGLAIVQLLFDVIYVGVFSLLFRNILKSSVEKTKKKDVHFISAVVIGFLLLYVAQILAGMIENSIFSLTGIEQETVENQQLIEELLSSAPIITIISACLLAPIEEELLFRGAIGKVIKNKKVFITVSGLIFGLVHVTDSIILVMELILIGVVLDNILESPKYDLVKKKKLSVAALAIILISFSFVYYFTMGNLINVISSLPATEVIGSIGYILMGCVLAGIYIYNDKNIFINMGVHAASNIFAVMISLFLK